MLGEAFDWVMSAQLTNLAGVILYWVPLSLCAVAYTARTSMNVRKDVIARAADPQHYRPTDTIGDLIGRGLATIVPVVNLWAAAFDAGPALFGRTFDAICKVFNQPLVPKRRQ